MCIFYCPHSTLDTQKYCQHSLFGIFLSNRWVSVILWQQSSRVTKTVAVQLLTLLACLSFLQLPQMQKRAEDLREQVRTIIKNTNQMPTMINLIIMLERLALDYHYENEINQLLNTVFSSDYDDTNLHLVSLRFYLLRKYGYNVSSGKLFNRYYQVSCFI
jgi:hypothetical protein